MAGGKGGYGHDLASLMSPYGSGKLPNDRRAYGDAQSKWEDLIAAAQPPIVYGDYGHDLSSRRAFPWAGYAGRGDRYDRDRH